MEPGLDPGSTEPALLESREISVNRICMELDRPTISGNRFGQSPRREAAIGADMGGLLGLLIGSCRVAPVRDRPALNRAHLSVRGRWLMITNPTPNLDGASWSVRVCGRFNR